VTFLLLVRPALEQLMGLTVSEPLRFKATTMSRLSSAPVVSTFSAA